MAKAAINIEEKSKVKTVKGKLQAKTCCLPFVFLPPAF
jgi:hypothetical protein